MKIFREPISPLDQLYLLPRSVQEFVETDAPVRILSEVVDKLDCSVLTAGRRGGGAPAYEPRMLFKLLVFAYGEGMRSSRRIAAACHHDMRFMFLAQMGKPNFRTICRFRKDNREAVTWLFAETVLLCRRLGLVMLEHVAVDGTKLEADVSFKATYKAERLEKELAELQAEIGRVLSEAEEVDALEDNEHGDARGDEIPEELRDLDKRKARLEAAKKAMDESGQKVVGLSDLESRVMKMRGGNRPSYNAQAAVDSAHQVIVAALVSQEANDQQQFAGLMEAVKANTGDTPEKVSADAGYYSYETLAYTEEQGLDAYIAEMPGQWAREGYEYDSKTDCFVGVSEATKGHVLSFYRERIQRGKRCRIYRHPRKKELRYRDHPAQEAAREATMHLKMNSPEGKSVYRLRKQVVEPVFGHLKGPFNLRRLLLRGLEGATVEYLLACCAHNIGKLRNVWRALDLSAGSLA